MVSFTINQHLACILSVIYQLNNMKENKYFQSQKQAHQNYSMQSYSVSLDRKNQIEVDSNQFGCLPSKIKHQNPCILNPNPFQILSLNNPRRKLEQANKEVEDELNQYKPKKFAKIPVFELQTIKQDSRVELYTFPKTATSFVLQYEYIYNVVLNKIPQRTQTQPTPFFEQLEFLQLYQAGNHFIEANQLLLAEQLFQISFQHPCDFIKYNSLGYVHYKSTQYNNTQKSNSIAAKILNHTHTNSLLINNLALIYLSNNRKDAKKLFQLSISRQPTVTALNNLGIFYFQQGNYLQAIKDFQASLEIYESLNALIGLASINACLGKYQLSNEMFQNAKNYQLSNKIVLNNLGQSHLLRKDLQEAQKHFLKGIELYPDYPHFYNGLALVRSQQKRLQQSMTLIQKAIQLQNCALFHSNYIIFLIRADRPDESIQYLRHISQSNNHRGEINLAQILHFLLYKYRYQRIVEIIDEFLPTQSKSLYKVLNYKAFILSYTNKHQRALQCLQLAFDESGQLIILLNIATLQHCLERHTQAMATIERAIELYPQQSTPHSFKAYFLLKQYNYEASKSCIMHLRKLKPLTHQTLNMLAVCEYGMRNYQRALKSIQNCLSLNPNYLPALNNKGIILSDKYGSVQNVNLYYPINTSNTFPEILYNRGNEFFKARRYKQAISCYKRAVQLNSKFVDAQLYLGEAQLKINDYKQGLKTLKTAYLLKPQCYKCSLLFSRNAAIYNSKKYCQKYMQTQQPTNLKVTLNLALMHNTLKNNPQFTQYIQLTLQNLFRSPCLSHNHLISQHLHTLKQNYSFLMDLFIDCDASDILLVIGYLQTYLNNLQAGERYIWAYICSFKLKRQALSDAFMRLVERRLSKYSGQYEYRFINCVIGYILKRQARQGVLCCIKLRRKRPQINLQPQIIALLEQNRQAAISQIEVFLNFYNALDKGQNKKQCQLFQSSKQIQNMARYIFETKKLLEAQCKMIKQLNLSEGKSYRKLSQQTKKLCSKNAIRTVLDSTCRVWAQPESFKIVVTDPISTFTKIIESVQEHQYKLQSLCCGNFIGKYMIDCYAYLQLEPYRQFYSYPKLSVRNVYLSDIRQRQIELKRVIEGYLSLQRQCWQEMSELGLDGGQREEILQIQDEAGTSSDHEEMEQPEQPIKHDSILDNCQKALVATNYKKTLPQLTNKSESCSLPPQTQKQNRSKSLPHFAKPPPTPGITFSRHKRRKNFLKQMHLRGEENSRLKSLTRSASQNILPSLFSCQSKLCQSHDASHIDKAICFIDKQEQPTDQAEERRAIHLRYVNSGYQTLLFYKLAYFSQIALVQQLSHCQSHYLASIRINQDTCLANKRINPQHLNNYYYEYNYYVSRSQAGYFADHKLNLNQCHRKELFQYLQQIGHIFIELTRLGIHLSDLRPHSIVKTGTQYRCSQFNSAYTILRTHQNSHSYELIRALVAVWLFSRQCPIQHEFMMSHLFKGLQENQITQIFKWKSQKARSRPTKTQLDRNLELIFSFMEQAMKKDHTRQFILLIEQVVKCANPYQLSQQDRQHIQAVLKQAREDVADAIGFMVSSLSLIENQELEGRGQENHYIGWIQVESNHKLQTNLC